LLLLLLFLFSFLLFN